MCLTNFACKKVVQVSCYWSLPYDSYMLQPYLAHAPVMAVKLLEMVFIKFGLFEI